LQYPSKSPFVFPNSKAHIQIDGKQVTSKHTIHIREAHHSIKLQDYYLSVNSWSSHTFHDVWWEPHGQAMNRLATGEKTTLQKFFHNRLPCNRRESRYYGYISPDCTKCGELEHQFHVLKCETCEKRIELRKKFLIDTHTSTTTIRVIVTCVKSFLSMEDPPEIGELDPNATILLQQAYEAQEDIGWDEWFKGRISKKWRDLYKIDLQSSQNKMFHQTFDVAIRPGFLEYQEPYRTWHGHRSITGKKNETNQENNVAKRKNWVFSKSLSIHSY
jgi:hypothetical protein